MLIYPKEMFKIQNLQFWVVINKYNLMVFIEYNFYCGPLNENNYDFPKPDADCDRPDAEADADCDQEIDEDYFN